ncbi:MAG: cell division protein SepF [Candidatus Thermoplasmatota archaeon]|jgi:hypothetical protein|nr:cell division protein SepF [Candidatus Thermoplasmatota archaeon]MDP7265904.1 cell division protein SepF [Candidatus Thermoplasmatota archaeon]
MKFLKRVKKDEGEEVEPIELGSTPEKYIDLGKFEGGGLMEEKIASVKMAEVKSFQDIRGLTSMMYHGNIMLLDITHLANDELELKRITSELNRVIEDINGDLCGVNRNLLLVTPRGIKIDRERIKSNV